MKKEILKEIKTLAAKLPISYDEGKKYFVKEIKDLRQKEIRNETINTDGNFKPLMSSDETEKVIVKGETLYKINHYRRLKKAYESDGIPGIKKYIKWVSQNNQYLNNKYRNQMVINLVDAKVKASITEFL